MGHCLANNKEIFANETIHCVPISHILFLPVGDAMVFECNAYNCHSLQEEKAKKTRDADSEPYCG